MVSQFDISGNSFNEEHSENIPAILITFFVFHLDISGNSFNEEHWLNIPAILITLFVFQLLISGTSSNKLHSENIPDASTILLIPFNVIINFLVAIFSLLKLK